MTNSTLVGNRASRSGGGLYVYGVSADASLANTIVAKNRAGTAAPDIRHASGILGGSNNLIGDGSGQTALVDGTDGNIVGTAADPVDPRLVRNPSPGTDGTWGTADDDYGDLRPRNDSPAVDAGDNALLPADSFDLDDDGDTSEQLPVDLDERTRIFNGTVDIGAYELHFRDGDLNGDGKVDSDDLDIVRSNWGQTVPPGVVGLGDPSGDGLVGAADLDIVREAWGTEPAAASATAASVKTPPVEVTPVETPFVEVTPAVSLPKPGRAAHAAATDAALVATVAERPQAGLSESDLVSLAQAAWMRELQSRENRANKRTVATVIPVWKTL